MLEADLVESSSSTILTKPEVQLMIDNSLKSLKNQKGYDEEIKKLMRAVDELDGSIDALPTKSWVQAELDQKLQQQASEQSKNNVKLSMLAGLAGTSAGKEDKKLAERVTKLEAEVDKLWKDNDKDVADLSSKIEFVAKQATNSGKDWGTKYESLESRLRECLRTIETLSEESGNCNCNCEMNIRQIRLEMESLRTSLLKEVKNSSSTESKSSSNTTVTKKDTNVNKSGSSGVKNTK